MKKTSQNGIAHLGLVLVVVVAAVVGFAGYKVAQNHNKTVNTAGSTTPAASIGQTIQTKADLNTAENDLNNQNIDGDLNPDQFNQDVNSLL